MTGTLYTLGYRGRKVADFPKLLPPDTLVVDVRLKPWSPAPMWQMGSLRKALPELGLRYLHDAGLGNLDYKSGGVRIQHPDEAAEIAALVTAGQTVALLCTCPEVAECHRLEVTRLILAADPSIPVVHLIAPSSCQETARLSSRPRGLRLDAGLRATSPATVARTGQAAPPRSEGHVPRDHSC